MELMIRLLEIMMTVWSCWRKMESKEITAEKGSSLEPAEQVRSKDQVVF